MKIALAAFTRTGAKTMEDLSQRLRKWGHSCACYASPRGGGGLEPDAPTLISDLGAWAREVFAQQDALIFISACGIAVRAIAPQIQGKMVDPAVVVLDEHGKFAVSLLSGHIGGANDLTLQIAGMLGAQPVITTATDCNHVFSIDRWAVKNGLWISDLKAAKEVSASLLSGEPVGFFSDFPLLDALPPGFVDCNARVGVYLSWKNRQPFPCTLNLVPRIVSLGIGCRRGVSEAKIASRVQEVLEENQIVRNALCGVFTIDRKANEPGLLAFCRAWGLTLTSYTAAQLAAVKGSFTPSPFVKEVTGVENVCERAAILGSVGKLLAKKQAGNGITVALAAPDWSVSFHGHLHGGH